MSKIFLEKYFFGVVYIIIIATQIGCVYTII